jgi:hypothetical protein
VFYAIAIPGADEYIALSRDDHGYIAQIELCQRDGTVRWRVLPPDGGEDAWTQVRVDGDMVVANSWSCWQVRLALTTGKELGRVFTK